jgi:hypothetical protein
MVITVGSIPHLLESKGMWQNHLATRLSDSATWRSDLADFLILEKMRYGGYSYISLHLSPHRTTPTY